jgi:hypothetical protein
VRTTNGRTLAREARRLSDALGAALADADADAIKRTKRRLADFNNRLSAAQVAALNKYTDAHQPVASAAAILLGEV